MQMLVSSMQVEFDRRNWRDYTAQILWSVGKLISEEYPFPSWTELHEEKQDDPTGDDIYNTLISRWGGGD